MSAWRRLFGYLAPYRGALAVAVVAMGGLAVTNATYPILLDLLTTILIGGDRPEAVASTLDRVVAIAKTLGFAIETNHVAGVVAANIVPLFGGVVAVKAVSQAVRFYAMGYIAQRVIRDLRTQLFDRIVKQGATFFGDSATGHLVSRVMNDVAQVERATTYGIPILIGDALRVVTLATACVVQYPRLSLVAFVVLPVAVLPIVQFGKALKRYGKRGQHALGVLTNRITETLGGIRVVHTYGREGYEVQRFDRESDQYLGVMMKSVFVRAVQTPLMELIGVVALLATIAYAVDEVEAGTLRPGAVVGFMLALILMYEPVKAIGRLNGIVMPGLAAAERVFEIIDREADVVDRPEAKPLAKAPELVRFESVSFKYREDTPLVLEGLDLDLPRGQVVALVGSSGAGKSTVAALLPRLFDVTDGRITVDGEDIRDVTLESLRANIAMVGQETYLFNDSVRDNIRYSRPDATDEQIEEAARRAYAHDFITALPDGYDTIAGERAVQLSGGQRQRLAIARAFLRDAPILILDEATSALDVESEREVQRALDALLENRTALVIAHRLSTVQRADEILVLEGGRVVERGRHEALLENDGPYRRFVEMSEHA
ncbi:MAG: ABC transporter ATP-binding protein [Deltaproteobacteria bacterium]